MATHSGYKYNGCEILACDFDDTIAANEHPLIGLPNAQLINKIKEFQASGGKFILWTCRGGKDLEAAVEFCKEQGIPPDAVNEDVPEVKNSEFGRNKSIKPYFDYCVDDKNNTIEGFIKMDFSASPSVFEPGTEEQSRISGIISFISK